MQQGQIKENELGMGRSSSSSSSSSKQGLGKTACSDFIFLSLFNSISSSDGLYLFFLLVDIVK
jgi:hypothetical protein